MKIGFIGLGIMGESMSENIIKKHDDQVYVFDFVKEKVELLESKGGIGCGSSLELAQKSDVIISMVPKSEHSMSVYKEVLPALNETKLCVDMSTIDPSVSVEISEMVKKTGAQFVDAPVVKSKPAAIAGKLGIYMGGDEAACAKAEPILSYMGENIIRMGGNGKGLVMKICHNALVSQIQNGVNETLTLAGKYGINIESYTTAISYGGGQNFYLDSKNAPIKNEDYTTAFSVENMYKDVNICMNMANECGMHLAGEAAAKAVYDKAMESGYGKEGMRAVAVSDTINGILLVIGSLLVVIFGFIAVGKLNGGGLVAGVVDVINSQPEKLNAIGGKNDPVPFMCIFTGMLLANLFYWGTNQVLIQRALGAKNLKEGQKGVLLSGFLKMMVPFLLVIPGVIAARLVSGLSSKDFAYPTLVANSLPWPITGLFCAALFGSIISTYNSFMNAASTVFMIDIYKPIFNPGLSEEATVKLAKNIGWGFAAFAIIFTPFLDVLSTGLYDFGRSFTGFYNIPIITMVLIGMFSKKGSTLGAVCATVFHIMFYACYKFIFPGIDTPFTNAVCSINYMNIYAISFIIMQ